MEFLPGFTWPVPRAFASAVAICRFEEGDVLYDRESAYTAAAPPSRGWHVQVLDPPRSARSAPADAEGNRFLANWDSPISIELCDYAARGPKRTREVDSTQGRLFTCLWKGSTSALSIESPPGQGPPVPRVARDLQKHLEDAAPALAVAARKAGASRDALVFVTVVDASSESSLAKGRAALARLSAAHRVRTVDLSPAEAGVPDGPGFHPALQLRGVAIEGADEAGVRALLKKALYGGRGAEEGGLDEASPPDRFKLERHGLLTRLDDAIGRKPS